MELRHLRYFVAVATERNFTRAAQWLGIAQPPLSRQIRELEEELGAPLFVRASRPVALTEAGRLLLDHATRVLAGVDQLRAEIRRLVAGERRRFVIGFVGSTIYGPVPLLIRRFREAAPEIDVELIEMNTLVQMKALEDGRIDAGFGRLLFENAAIARRVIEQEPLVAVLPLGHPLAATGDPVALARLIEETLILYPNDPRPSYADQLLAIFRAHDLMPKRVREVRELQTGLGLVAAHAGICIVPQSVQRLGRDDIVYRPLAEPDAVSPIILSWRAADVSAQIQTLGRICNELMRDEVAV
ncbi:LysR family transcriptional regulator [Flavisphingomonas formosensis]|uniref:LysR family transcriptional regulator n=1 Tax=Flavisphingomonas formosensis TaxID=861534 RepID=UPI0012FBFD22|nr:LysR family transcriptional regulator [Sphingomonas formosensis]